MRNTAAIYTQELSEKLNNFVISYQPLWKYQAQKYFQVIEEFTHYKDIVSVYVVDKDGIAVSGFDFNNDKGKKESGIFTITEKAPITFNNRVAGMVYLSVPRISSISVMLAILFSSMTLGISISLFVYHFPLKVVRGVEKQLLQKTSELQEEIIERKRTEEKIKNLSLTDELTGIYNRRGFFTFANQQLKVASRMKKGVLLFYADMDDLKLINDNMGHQEGDRAIIDASNVLKKTFRESDIIARMGGDEFAVMMIEASDSDAEVMTDRLQKNVDFHNAKKNRPYRLSLSFGFVRYNHDYPQSIDDLLAKADSLMYEYKKRKKSDTNKLV